MGFKQTFERYAAPGSLPESLRAAVSWVLAALALFMPLAVVPGLADSYTLPKVAIVRLALGLVVMFWAVRLAIDRRIAWVKTPLDWPVAGLMAVSVLAAVLSTNRGLSFFGHYKRFEDVFTLVGYGLFYFAAANNLRRDDGRRFVSAALVAAGTVSVYAVCQYLGYDFLRTSAPVGRATGTLGNAVFLGLFLALMLPMALGRLAGGRGRFVSLGYLALTAIIGAGLVLTFSRGAWVGAAVGVAVLAAVFRRLGSRRRLAAGILAIALIFLAANLYRHPGVKKASPVVERAISSLDTGKGSVRTRLLLWRTTLGLIAQRPLFGHGPDTLVLVYPYYLPDAFKEIEPLARIDKAHNDLLNVGATIGLLGLAAYLTLTLVFVLVLLDRGRAPVSADGPPGEGEAVAAGLVAYAAAVQFSFSQVEVAALFWPALAVSMIALGVTRSGPPIPLDSLVSRAAAWLAAAAVAAAAPVFLYLFAVQPLVADYHFQRGLSAEDHGRWRRAREEFESAVAYSQTRSLYYYRLGRRYQLDAAGPGSGREFAPALARAALTAYANAEALDRSDPNLYTALGSLYTSLYRSRRDGRFAALANQAFERSLALNRYLPETFVDIGVLQAELRQREAAIKSFKAALELDPKNRTARDNLTLIAPPE